MFMCNLPSSSFHSGIVNVYSRALGNYKRGSDVDLAVVGDEITHQTIAGLHEALNEEYPLPYMFDVVHYDALTNDNLRRHIDTYG